MRFGLLLLLPFRASLRHQPAMAALPFSLRCNRFFSVYSPEIVNPLAICALGPPQARVFDTRTGRLTAHCARPTQQNICHFVAFAAGLCYNIAIQTALQDLGPLRNVFRMCFYGFYTVMGSDLLNRIFSVVLLSFQGVFIYAQIHRLPHSPSGFSDLS